MFDSQACSVKIPEGTGCVLPSSCFQLWLMNDESFYCLQLQEVHEKQGSIEVRHQRPRLNTWQEKECFRTEHPSSALRGKLPHTHAHTCTHTLYRITGPRATVISLARDVLVNVAVTTHNTTSIFLFAAHSC